VEDRLCKGLGFFEVNIGQLMNPSELGVLRRILRLHRFLSARLPILLDHKLNVCRATQMPTISDASSIQTSLWPKI